MERLKKYFKKSNKGAILIIALVLLCLYGFTISSFLASVPSEGFSREIEIEKVTSGKQISINSHVETIRISDEETMITAVDNHQLKLIIISRLGAVVDEKVVELDLFNAIDISASIDTEGILSLYYNKDHLYQVTIDLETLKYSEVKVADDVIHFIRNDEVIVFQQKTGLYVFNINDNARVLPLVNGDIKSFVMDKEEASGIYHLMTTIRNIVSVDIRYVQFDHDLTISHEFLIKENSGNSYLKYIRAIYVEGDVLTGVYVWSDNVYGKNYVTIHQYDTKTGELSTDYRREFSLHRGRYLITDVEEDKVTLLFQEDVHYGINIVEVVISKEDEPIIKPLTKTKKISFISDYFTFGEDQVLIFFDLTDGDKIIYFATSNAEIVESTTKATTINPIRIIGLIIIVIFQAAFTGAVVYLLFVALGPFILLLLMNKFLPGFKNKIYVQSGISVVIHTGLKIYLTYQLIHVMETYILTPPFVGEEPFIYIFMILMSIISYYLMSRYIKWNIDYASTPMEAYLQFILFEYVSYTLMVYIYITTYLVISKI